MSDFQGEKRMKYFSNSISFTNKKLDNIESLKTGTWGQPFILKKHCLPKELSLLKTNKWSPAFIFPGTLS